MSILLVADERFAEHRPPEGHPERPARFAAAIEGVDAAGFGDALVWRAPTEASVEALLGVHARAHVDRIISASGQDHLRIDPDTHMSAGSLTAARLAAGAGLDAIQALQRGEADSAFCMVRPPGHHATPTRAMGFCLFNNIAVTAQALTDTGDRVAIIDIDAHHGNGTQDAFYGRDDVLFVSFHEYPQYPGSGALDERGSGAGANHTINLPMPSRATGDVYLRAFDQVVEPALEQFGPDWVLISAGFDAHRADPLTSLGLTAGDYAALGARLMSISSPGRLIAFLEGGYDLDALADSSAAFVGALLGVAHVPEPQTNGGPGNAMVDAWLDVLA
jgi:acetoin utilization deacetylase AcuC-like enzyme